MGGQTLFFCNGCEIFMEEDDLYTKQNGENGCHRCLCDDLSEINNGE